MRSRKCAKTLIELTFSMLYNIQTSLWIQWRTQIFGQFSEYSRQLQKFCFQIGCQFSNMIILTSFTVSKVLLRYSECVGKFLINFGHRIFLFCCFITKIQGGSNLFAKNVKPRREDLKKRLLCRKLGTEMQDLVCKKRFFVRQMKAVIYQLEID